jgi:hypothetical protein
MEKWLGFVLSKYGKNKIWQEQDAMRREEEGLARTIRGQKHEELKFSMFK